MTLLALAGFLGKLAFDSYAEAAGYLGEVVVLGSVAAMLVAGALWMGVRVVRGPQPPELD